MSEGSSSSCSRKSISNVIFENCGNNLNNPPNVDSSNKISCFSSKTEKHKTYLMKNVEGQQAGTVSEL